jgi:hypothetical protein
LAVLAPREWGPPQSIPGFDEAADELVGKLELHEDELQKLGEGLMAFRSHVRVFVGALVGPSGEATLAVSDIYGQLQGLTLDKGIRPKAK